MTPTHEQQAILGAAGKVIRINARAGTGKTTTLQMLAKKYRDQRILYLVFNRRAKEEARNSFPSNVDAMTVHALAYRYEGYKWKETLGHFSPADMLSAFGPREQLLATLSHDFLVYFLNSPFEKLESAVHPFFGYLPENARDLFQHAQQKIIRTSRSIATDWNTGRKSCPHDFYLKLCHKSKSFQAALNRYDLILVDEGQDLSPIMLDSLKHCPKRIFLVGDSHQQIYSFRYAIDAMHKLHCDEEYELSQSFRFGSAIAELATVFIQEAKKERQFRIHGNQKKNSTVSLYRQMSTFENAQNTAILSRSNVALFENAMHLRGRVIPFRFEKDLYPLLMKTLDVYWLAESRTEQIRDPLIRTFNHVDDLEEYAKDTENFQLQGMVQIVERYADEFPGVVFELSELTKERGESQKSSGVILSTIHSAKGKEYDQVYIDPDMAENLDTVFRNDLEHENDEINVAYVGFTRAKQRLHLPYEMQKVLTPRWDTLLQSYFPSQRRTTSGRPNPPQSLQRRPAPVQPPATRQKRTYHPGDKVNTSFGPGKILEISGEYCLVDLGYQETRLRERLSNVW